MINIRCTICMRGGSKGISNKNIRIINGKPLLYYTIDQAKKSKLFNKIVVSTDSNEIKKLSLKFGVDHVFLRPKKMAKDNSPKLPVIMHIFKTAEKFYNTKFDVLVDLDATSPLRNIKDIINSYKMFVKNKSPNLISACISKKNPYYNIIEYKNKKLSISKKNIKIPDSRQQTPITYDMNASIYIWTRGFLLKENSLFSGKLGFYEMPEDRSIDIDSPLDWEIVKMLMEKRSND